MLPPFGICSTNVLQDMGIEVFMFAKRVQQSVKMNFREFIEMFRVDAIPILARVIDLSELVERKFDPSIKIECHTMRCHRPLST